MNLGMVLFVCLSSMGRANSILPFTERSDIVPLASHYSTGFIRSRYAFSISTYGKAQVVELKQPPSEFRSVMEGELIVVGAIGTGSLTGSIVISKLQLRSGADRLYAEEKAMMATLSLPFRLTRAGGKVTGCSFVNSVAPESRKVIRTVLAIAGLPLSSQGRGEQFTVDDTVGTKLVLAKRPGMGSLQLKEERYVANTSNALKLTLTGTWRANMSKENLLGFMLLQGHEFLDALVTKSSHSATQMQAEIKHISTSAAPKMQSSENLSADYSDSQPLWTRPSEDEVLLGLAKHTLHGLTNADVFRIAENLGTKEQSDQSGTDAFSKLRALVIVSDTATKEVGRRLKSASVESPQFVVYGQALISGGSPPSSKCLSHG